MNISQILLVKDMKTFVVLGEDWIVKAYSDAMADWFTRGRGDDSYDVESDSE